MDLEALKDILKDDKLHIGIGIIKRLHLASDRSYLKVSLSVLPEQREIIATMTWENVGPDSGDFEFPSQNDLVLFAQAEGDDDQAFVIKRLTSREDKIPAEAATGDKVHRAKAGKKYWNVSDTNIYLSRSGTVPTENLVLGQELKALMSDILAQLAIHAQTTGGHDHIGNLGFKTTPPNQAGDYTTIETAYNDLKASPVDDETILSDLAFTEK